MNKLDLCPLQSSYSVKYGTSVERIALKGGFGRYVQTKNAKKHLVDVSFTLREDDFIYFRAFYLNWQLNPLPFLMSLIIEDSEFREYIAQFVPESFSFNELKGNIFKVSAQIVVVTSEVQILTSKPYPVLTTDFIESLIKINKGYSGLNTGEDLSIEVGIRQAKLSDLIEYTTFNTGFEVISQKNATISSASLKDTLSYVAAPTSEGFQSNHASIKTAKVQKVLVSTDLVDYLLAQTASIKTATLG